MQIIADTLSQITVGEPVSIRNLTVFPLLSAADDIVDYLTLDEALEKRLACVTEISKSGSVSELSFVNRGDWSVLLLDGEELIGAKQNRILNLTILVPAHRELKIPVSCVEQGRWRYRSGVFSSSPRAQSAMARANKVASVTFSLRKSGRPVSDQSEVWRDIDRLATELKVSSPTNAMSDIYDSYSDDLHEKARAFSAGPGQVGAVFAINGEVIGLDLFDSSSTFGKLLGKLVNSYALQAIASGLAGVRFEVHDKTDAQGLLRSLLDADTEAFPSIGEGQNVRIKDDNLAAAALVARDRLVHLCAFPIKEDR
ncbi:MAG TPA: DUF6569 family protein [Blastocatellia bacterium]|nr:DUF6569 family protein [Blastocatellia bacterium]